MVPAQMVQSSVWAPTKTTLSFVLPCASGRSSGGGAAADESFFVRACPGSAHAAVAPPAALNPAASKIRRENLLMAEAPPQVRYARKGCRQPVRCARCRRLQQ